MIATTLNASSILADPTDDLNSVIDGAGPLSFLFLALLGIALFFIIRSMNRQMKKVDQNLPPGKADRRRAFDESIIIKAEEAGEQQAATPTSQPTNPTATPTATPTEDPQA